MPEISKTLILKGRDGGRDRTRTCDLLRVNLSVNPYIADSFSGLLRPMRPPCVSTALIEQHSEQQFGCVTEAVLDDVGRRSTTAILLRYPRDCNASAFGCQTWRCRALCGLSSQLSKLTGIARNALGIVRNVSSKPAGR